MRSCLKRCRHCQILFITDPRNRGRNDLGCPFGCRDVHSKSSSNKRSTRYYQTDEGKLKKKHHNDRRGGSDSSKDHAGADDHVIDPAMLCHIRMVVSLIEQRCVALIEIVGMLVRQRSMDLHKNPMYKCPHSIKHPP